MIQRLEWKDMTTYSRGDKERVPRIWYCNLKGITIKVHRYLHENGWYLTCSSGLDLSLHLTESDDVELAKKLALEVVAQKLENAIQWFNECLECLADEIAEQERNILNRDHPYDGTIKSVVIHKTGL